MPSIDHSRATTGIQYFAVSLLFAVCWLMAKMFFAISCPKADGKELTDGKNTICHVSALCRLPADGKGTNGRRQRACAGPMLSVAMSRPLPSAVGPFAVGGRTAKG